MAMAMAMDTTRWVAQMAEAVVCARVAEAVRHRQQKERQACRGPMPGDIAALRLKVRGAWPSDSRWGLSAGGR